MSIYFTAVELRRSLGRLVKAAGGVRAAARDLHVSAGHLSRVMRGKKALDGKILSTLRFRAVTRYVPVESRQR